MVFVLLTRYKLQLACRQLENAYTNNKEIEHAFTLVNYIKNVDDVD